MIRLVVMYAPFPLLLRNVEYLLFERGFDICHETVRMWWNRFGPMFAGDVRQPRVSRMRGFRHWQRHPDEMYVKPNGEMVYLWRPSITRASFSKATSPKPATRRRRSAS